MIEKKRSTRAKLRMNAPLFEVLTSSGVFFLGSVSLYFYSVGLRDIKIILHFRIHFVVEGHDRD